MFWGAFASRDVVITPFGHFVKLASLPGALGWLVKNLCSTLVTMASVMYFGHEPRMS